MVQQSRRDQVAKGDDLAASVAVDDAPESLTQVDPPTPAVIRDGVRLILQGLGENVGRPGLQDTPMRVERMFMDLTDGYWLDPEWVINDALFPAPDNSMVVVGGVKFYSLCEHHLLPFFGTAVVGYVPDGFVLGLSKLPRVIDMFARRLQMQERLTQEIADFLVHTIHPRGLGVILDAHHLCVSMRGVRQPRAHLVTSHLYGTIKDQPAERSEFFAQARPSFVQDGSRIHDLAEPDD